MKISILLFTILFFSTMELSAGESSDFYCKKRSLGWNFYCDPQIEIKEDEDGKKVQTVVTKKNNPNPQEELKKIQDELEFLKAKAILYPSSENVEEYLYFQKQQMNRASMFADVYQRVSWQNSDLNYLLKVPTNSIGKKVWKSEREKDIKATLHKDINQHYGLFFFFRSDCPYCHAYAPILKRFAERYGISVMAISLDGKSIKEFPNYRTNDGQAERLGVTAVPATILFNKKQGDTITIGHGLLAESELSERIYLLTKVEAGDDF